MLKKLSLASIIMLAPLSASVADITKKLETAYNAIFTPQNLYDKNTITQANVDQWNNALKEVKNFVAAQKDKDLDQIAKSSQENSDILLGAVQETFNDIAKNGKAKAIRAPGLETSKMYITDKETEIDKLFKFNPFAGQGKKDAKTLLAKVNSLLRRGNIKAHEDFNTKK